MNMEVKQGCSQCEEYFNRIVELTYTLKLITGDLSPAEFISELLQNQAEFKKALDKLEGIEAGREEVFPRQPEKRGGWTISTEFIERIEEWIDKNGKSPVQWEEIESVLLAVEALQKSQ